MVRHHFEYFVTRCYKIEVKLKIREIIYARANKLINATESIYSEYNFVSVSRKYGIDEISSVILDMRSQIRYLCLRKSLFRNVCNIDAMECRFLSRWLEITRF